MDTLTVSEAKAQLSKVVQRVLAGERIAIGRRGQPEVVLHRFDVSDEPRELGGYAGPFRMAEDFDATADDVIAAFEGAE